MAMKITSENLQQYLVNKGVDAAKAKEVANKTAADGVLSQAEINEIVALSDDIKAADLQTEFGIDEAGNLGETKAGTGKYSNMSTADIVAALKKDYGGKAVNGDAYSGNNANLADLKKAMDAGVIEELFASGLSKSDVADIIGKVFDGVGIGSNGNGGYTCPYGHGEDAQKIYDEFTRIMAKAGGGIDAVKNDPEIKRMQAELDANNLTIMSNNLAIQSNNTRIEKIKAEMDQLKQEVTEAIETAIKESEEIQAEHKENASKIVADQIALFTAAEGDMTYDQFRSNLKNKLDDSAGQTDSKLSAVIGKMLDAESRLSKLDGMLQNLGALLAENDELMTANDALTKTNAKLTQDISDRTKELLEDAQDDDCNRCDPIGFEANGKKYDFFVDENNDGNLSNESEFLGATDGWAAMEALDKDHDGKITKAELQGAENLKMVVTNKDGTQEVQSIAEVFADAADNAAVIDLNSYKDVNQDVNKDVRLLGTYQIDLDGIGVGNDAVEGYNTLDSTTWLRKNYKFSDLDNEFIGSEKGADGLTSGYTKANFADTFEESFEDFTQSITDLHGKWEAAWQTIGIDASESVKAMRASEEAHGKLAADKLNDKFEQYKLKEEEKRIREAEEAEAAQAAQNDANAGNTNTRTEQIDQALATALDNRCGAGFSAKVEEIAKKLNCDPNDLLGMMYSESGINPQAVNKSSGATGLIQFMPQTAKGLGTTTEALKNMSAIEQLDYVEKFFESAKNMAKIPDGKPLEAGTLYALVFLPAFANRDVLTVAGEGYYNSNKGLDVNNDGKITIEDLTQRVRAKTGEMRNAFV